MFFTKLYIFDEIFYFDTLDTNIHMFPERGLHAPCIDFKIYLHDIYVSRTRYLSVHLGTFYFFFCLF